MPRPRSEQSELEPAVRLPAVPYFAEIARQLTMVQKLHARQLRTLGRRGYQLRDADGRTLQVRHVGLAHLPGLQLTRSSSAPRCH